MWPYRPGELFRVNPNCRAALVRDDPPVVVVDDFYATPEKVRELVLAMPYPIWKHQENSRNFVDYYDCRHNLLLDHVEPQMRVAELAHRLMRIHVHGSTRHFRTNLFRSIVDQRAGTQAHPHFDGLAVAALVYLNLAEECSGGTAFYKHRGLGVEQLPREQQSRDRLAKQIFEGSEAEDGSDYFHEWQKNWEVTQVVEMKFNRVVIWPGLAFHGAWHEPNSFRDYWRVNHVMFLDQVEYLDD